MTIQPLTGKASNIALPSKSAANEKEKISETKVKDKSDDSVAITKLAKEITKAFESTGTKPPVNKEHVEAIKLALEKGTYSINAERTAEKMVHVEGQFNNSR